MDRKLLVLDQVLLCSTVTPGLTAKVLAIDTNADHSVFRYTVLFTRLDGVLDPRWATLKDSRNDPYQYRKFRQGMAKLLEHFCLDYARPEDRNIDWGCPTRYEEYC